MHWRHEQLALRMVYHSHGAPRAQTTATRTRAEERETYSAPRRQEPPLPAVTTGTQFFTLDDESVPVTGERPAALLEPRLQGRVQRRTVEHVIDVLLHVQILDVPVPQMGDQLVESMQRLDTATPVQVIAVPKISLDRILQRFVPFVVSFSSLWQQSAGQIIDIPVPRGRRGGGGGLQSFLPVQNSTAPSQQIVDIPVRSGGLQGFRPGQVSTASASLPRSADEAVEGGFRAFPRVKKKCGVQPAGE